MNALEIIERVRAHGAEVFIADGRLKVRGRGEELPEDLRRAIVEQKAAIMVALGVPWEKTVASILADLRPQLPASLRKLPDGHLLALINWSIIHSWNKAVAKALDNR